jgi:hypothetical protein
MLMTDKTILVGVIYWKKFDASASNVTNASICVFVLSHHLEKVGREVREFVGFLHHSSVECAVIRLT